MGFFHRILGGALRQATAGLRAVAAPFTFAFKEAGTILSAAKDLVTLHPLKALGTLVGGTVSNAGRMGVDMLEGGVPGLAFAEGFIRDKGMFESGGGLGLT